MCASGLRYMLFSNPALNGSQQGDQPARYLAHVLWSEKPPRMSWSGDFQQRCCDPPGLGAPRRSAAGDRLYAHGCPTGTSAPGGAGRTGLAHPAMGDRLLSHVKRRLLLAGAVVRRSPTPPAQPLRHRSGLVGLCAARSRHRHQYTAQRPLELLLPVSGIHNRLVAGGAVPALESVPVRRDALLSREPDRAALPDQSALLCVGATPVLGGRGAAAPGGRGWRYLSAGAAPRCWSARRAPRRRRLHVRGL